MKKLKDAKSAGFEVFPTQLGFSLPMAHLYIPSRDQHDERGRLEDGDRLCADRLVSCHLSPALLRRGHPSFLCVAGHSDVHHFHSLHVVSPDLHVHGLFTANFIGWYTDRRKFTISLVLFGIIETIPLIKNASMLGKDLLFMIPFFSSCCFRPSASAR